MSQVRYKKMNIFSVLFDLDGTLLDTIPDLASACNAMRIDLGLPALPEARIATFVGKGSENLVQRALTDLPNPPADYSQALESFYYHYQLCNGQHSRLYPGVLEGLNDFQSQGLRLAVVTNKPEQFARPLLEKTGLAHYFELIVGGDTCPRKKPDPMPFVYACEQMELSPSQALVIGDSMNDAQAARAAQIPVLLVPYGYNEGRDVQSLDSDGIVASIADAATWLRAKRDTLSTS
ncbi:phosphoglycolate phosphatase, bacterial [Alcaligenes pakistanensis]|uniref:Phosphoglycolate phosphatase n=2 Tax=Alcaligenes pakistanensis TaxID=1482717 RepID=A0A8H9M6W5_9BURK|nr:phosphoglycolate phosphatase, bacterial [Alcaligenes pakistanensis]HCA18489.1 phosphoglycolate phosphatase [Alcaligenes faecalis]